MLGEPCEQQGASMESRRGVHRAAKERGGVLIGRARREDDRRWTAVEKLQQRWRELLLVGLVVLRESCQSHLRTPLALLRHSFQSRLRSPIGLRRREPIRKQANYPLR